MTVAKWVSVVMALPVYSFIGRLMRNSIYAWVMKGHEKETYGSSREDSAKVVGVLAGIFWPSVLLGIGPWYLFFELPWRAANGLPKYLENRKKAQKAELQEQLRESLNLTEDEEVVVTPDGCGCKACITYRAQMNATYKRMP